MELVEPIKDIQKIADMKEALRINPNTGLRDEAMFVMGINTGLRISDIVTMVTDDVLDGMIYRESVVLKERKTGKRKVFPLNESVRKTLKIYLDTRNVVNDEPLFPSRSKKNMSRVRFWQILNKAATKIGLKHIGTHTLRKTFGYHVFVKSERNLALVQKLLNHSSSIETLRYIGIAQEELNNAYLGLNL
ncbi:site-specific integrase [Synergistales bacterium]|nr:site-specific integrase [Synergistales bacterium]